MADRKSLIVGNWKMHNNVHDASLYVHALDGLVHTYRDVEVVLCPTLLALQTVSLQVDRKKFQLGAQNCYWRDEGAYPGVSTNEIFDRKYKPSYATICDRSSVLVRQRRNGLTARLSM